MSALDLISERRWHQCHPTDAPRRSVADLRTPRTSPILSRLSCSQKSQPCSARLLCSEGCREVRLPLHVEQWRIHLVVILDAFVGVVGVDEEKSMGAPQAQLMSSSRVSAEVGVCSDEDEILVGSGERLDALCLGVVVSTSELPSGEVDAHDHERRVRPADTKATACLRDTSRARQPCAGSACGAGDEGSKFSLLLYRAAVLRLACEQHGTRTVSSISEVAETSRRSISSCE